MGKKPTYEDLEQRVRDLERESLERKRAEEALRESEGKYRELADLLPQTVFEIDERGKFTFANCYGFESSGYARQDIDKGLNAVQLFIPEDRGRIMRDIRKILSGEKCEGHEYTLLRKDGSTFPVLIYSSPIIRGNKPVGLRGIAIDMTDRKRAEEALAESEEKYRSLVESPEDSIYLVDGSCRYLFMNEKHLLRFGLLIDEVIGRAYSEFHSEKETKEFAGKVQEVFETGKSLWYEYRSQRDGGYFLRTLSPVRELNGRTTAVTVVSKNITELKRAEEALRESEERYRGLSITDDLTQLYNSRHFYDQLRTEIERATRYNRPLSLLLLDIDNFKHYNDTYGHLEGNGVLAKLGEVIQESLRQTDSAYRYGGEEFTVILPETNGEEAVTVAERMRKRFEAEPFPPTFEEKVHKTVSIGVAQHQPEEEFLAFIRRVDKAMYAAKAQGKNRVAFSKSPDGDHYAQSDPGVHIASHRL
ncbi:MAG: diguanylate cyclase [Deltaproteobacteria bacterium]|nr:MAG: diguanylate cyclase [Deltaproteobacteria bacterium]